MKILTPHKIEILKLMAQGMLSKQIAEKLSMSLHTAKKHRQELIEFFGAKNAANLIYLVTKKEII